MKSLWTFNCEVDLPLEEAQQVFFDFREGSFNEYTAPLLVKGKGDVKITFDRIHFVVEFTDGHREFASIEKEKSRIVIQGEWWYRGEYTLTAVVSPGGTENKTNVQLEVFNLADQEWMVSLMNIGAKKKHEIAFQSLCRRAARASRHLSGPKS